MRRGRDAHLFADRADITDVVEHVRQALKRKLDGLDSQRILAMPVDDLAGELVNEFRLNVPVLRRDAIQQLPNEEIDIDVSRDHNRIFRSPGPHYVNGTAVRVAVPFDGDSALFKYPSSSFGVPVEGEVVDDTIVLTYSAEHPDPAAAKNEFDARLGQIDNTLNFLRGKTADWNGQLPQLVRSRIAERRAKLERDKEVTLGYPMAPPKSAVPAAASRTEGKTRREPCDLFLSHASEDKDAIARPLYNALTAAGVSVWFDEAVLELGDSLRRKIDEGLARSRYGIVILSLSFFSKHWPQKELDGLVARETASGEKAILPIWHDVDQKAVTAYSPTLADRVAGRSAEGVAALVEKSCAYSRENSR
jgi:TIR domain